MIDVNLFCQKRPFLYHLTSQENFPAIVADGLLWSASHLLFASTDPDARNYVRRRRTHHVRIRIRGHVVHIRDQRPISERGLGKCLVGGLQVGDYYQLLNERIFFWPTVSRLERHYRRYHSEAPIILRFSTREVLRQNLVEFSRLNSGATRANSYLGGLAPQRGRDTFLAPAQYGHGISSVAEVTVQHRCTLPTRFESGLTPIGPWTPVNGETDE